MKNQSKSQQQGKTEQPSALPAYEAPRLSRKSKLSTVTLFSGNIDPTSIDGNGGLTG